MALLPLSENYTRAFYMVDSTDHISKKTGLTVTVNISKAGAAFGAAGGTVSEIANGFYKVALTTTDTNTAGDLAFHCTATGADDTQFVDQVDAAVGSVVGAVGSVTGNVGGNVAGSVASVTAAVTVGTNNDKTGYRLSATGVDDLWDEVVDGVTTGRESMRLANSANGGKLSGAATATILVRDIADSKNRISATVDASGNRTAITRDLT